MHAKKTHLINLQDSLQWVRIYACWNHVIGSAAFLWSFIFIVQNFLFTPIQHVCEQKRLIIKPVYNEQDLYLSQEVIILCTTAMHFKQA